MPTLRITFRYNNKSPLNNVVTVERVPFKSKADGYAFLASYKVLMEKRLVDKEIVDYEWALVGVDNTDVQILKNPTGGVEGKVDQTLFRNAESRER